MNSHSYANNNSNQSRRKNINLQIKNTAFCSPIIKVTETSVTLHFDIQISLQLHAYFIIFPGIVKDAFGRGRLSGVNMGHNAYIADFLQVFSHRPASFVSENMMNVRRVLGTHMGECLVGFGHSVDFLFLLEGGTLRLVSGHDFLGQFVGHGLLMTLASERD